CAVVTTPVPGAIAQCECTTCRFNTSAQACGGTCPLGRACVAGAAFDVCTCAPVPPSTATPAPAPPTPAPAPTPAPPCGVWKGLGSTAPGGAGPNAFLCDPPQCASDPTRLCAIVDALPVPYDPAAPAPACACTTCHYDAASERCNGTCPLG